MSTQTVVAAPIPPKWDGFAQDHQWISKACSRYGSISAEMPLPHLSCPKCLLSFLADPEERPESLPHERLFRLAAAAIPGLLSFSTVGGAAMDVTELQRALNKPGITPVERKRLERLLRSQNNRRGRKQPVVIPAELTRTSAFAPRQFGLIEDANFRRVYVVTARSVIEVTGRELGSQHRDALYAIFRLPSRKIKLAREADDMPNLPGIPQVDTIIEAHGTWRQVLQLMNLSEHANNMLTVLKNFEELRSVNLRVFTGSYSDYQQYVTTNKLRGAGFSDNFLGRINWDGARLDSKITIRYGEWLRWAFEQKRLVSLNSVVYFSLQSDYAKSFWPYIDGQPEHTWVDETVLGELIGRDPMAMTPRERSNFREGCRRAFDDITAAGGFVSWRIEVIGRGRVKLQRYHYVHALPRAIDLAARATQANLGASQSVDNVGNGDNSALLAAMEVEAAETLPQKLRSPSLR
ncbi:hypothetical protein [Muricoccus aerilatus]|uniref:hypothetical protein n=1 Tax=Muricoccus aerilatus TaxID=452982 RepID=UPI0012EB11AA|nr:hypothetical protein [Roseomonas aerilata]